MCLFSINIGWFSHFPPFECQYNFSKTKNTKFESKHFVCSNFASCSIFIQWQSWPLGKWGPLLHCTPCTSLAAGLVGVALPNAITLWFVWIHSFIQLPFALSIWHCCSAPLTIYLSACQLPFPSPFHPPHPLFLSPNQLLFFFYSYAPNLLTAISI